MSDNTFSTPWMVFRKGDKPSATAIAAHPGAVLIAYFVKIRGDYDPVIHLIKQAPSMLALLEKALPIIEAEADMRDAIPGAPFSEREGYWMEMRDLANEIKAEINKAYGRETPEPELCPHGFGFVEYCPDCTDKEIKAKWSAKEDQHG